MNYFSANRRMKLHIFMFIKKLGYPNSRHERVNLFLAESFSVTNPVLTMLTYAEFLTTGPGAVV